MNDTGGKFSDGGEPTCVNQLLLKLFDPPDIPKDGEGANEVAVVVVDAERSYFDWYFRPVPGLQDAFRGLVAGALQLLKTEFHVL